ncbi:2-dehydropantoate 2-reductase [Neiella marina]|uniref:2-dehydropantoate 2-reductase n=1 Tax=Neiella marina TaxID=508461 RepID=A0A8J2XNU5_9GAMM|nr:2-dehydropantoate 2-reductase [Neiella marina]GGA71379.1 2-dehydropantoate 2-reductase [Neiella marina]
MKILICGAGAVGQLYGGMFAAAGHQVSCYGSQGPVAPTEYRLQRIDGSQLVWHCHQVQQPSVVIVCTKAYQVETAVAELINQKLLLPTTHLVLLHNGLGPHESIAKRLNDETSLTLASTRQGALRLSPQEVKHTGLGATDLGLFQGPQRASDKILALFQQSIGDCHWHPNVLQPLWHKLLINSVINPLTARDQVTNGYLCGDDYQSEIIELCAEACDIANACGIDAQPQQLYRQVLLVAEATASNRSSMLQDVSAGRPTEIDYINGYLIKRAEHHGLPIAAHRALVAQLTDKQQG